MTAAGRGVVGIVCGAYGLCAIAIYAIYFTKFPWQDWMVYYTAARAVLGLHGAIRHAHDDK